MGVKAIFSYIFIGLAVFVADVISGKMGHKEIPLGRAVPLQME